MPTPSFTDIIRAYLEAQFGGDVPPIPGVTIDDELSTTSENPVMNRVITAALALKAAIADIPTKVSQLRNDAGYQTAAQVRTAISAAVPTKTSDLTNDSGFQTAAQVQAAIAAIPNAWSFLPTDTASGAIASFPDGADDAPVKSLVAQIAPVQSGSGDPSPTNIRPISGWTSATVTRTGADNQTDTYTIAFPSEAGTVYGGTLDVVKGVLVVDRAMVVLGSLNFGKYGDNEIQRYYTTGLSTLIKRPSNPSELANIITSCFKVITQIESWDQDGTVSVTTNGEIFFMTSAYSTVSDFINAMSDVQLCYELATPITYQLTPQEVSTLLGQNNIWADTGDVAVDYRADIGLYIQKLTGSTETS